jgi:hypothetical protein
MGLMAALFATFAITARAADTGSDVVPSTFAAMSREDPMNVMHMMDTNHDGFVTRDEFMKFQTSFFDRMDKNKDGRLTAPEWTGDRSKDGGG